MSRGKLIRYIAIALCVFPPLAATVSQFPVWIEKSAEATMSGTFIVFAFLSALPFIKQIIAYFKSPSCWAVWCAILLVLLLIRNIIDEIILVCAIGAPSNIIGMFLYKLGASMDGAGEGSD